MAESNGNEVEMDVVKEERASPHQPSPTAAEVKIDVKSSVKSAASDKNAVTLTWKDLSFSVPFRKEQRQLLNNVSGCVRPGEVVAIMGSSGAGKSTLLNVLAGRVGPGTISGTIHLNGKDRNPKTWQRTVAYVEQDDLMYRNLTVRETLTYAAMLRLPSSQFTKQQKLDKVNNIIASLGLSKCENTIIGDSEERGISGGERKRVAIGVELVTEPQLLFLDEPTSGLDAFTASYIIETIKKLAVKEQKTVLLTIHQPREYILSMFDKIILLSGGVLVYYGGLQGAIDHFSKCNFNCPSNTNPSDFFLDIMTIDYRSPELKEKSTERVKLLQGSWPKDVMQSLLEEDSKRASISDANDLEGGKNPGGKWANSFIVELAILFHRNWIDVIRDKPTIFATIGQSVVNCLILGFIFFQVTNDTSGIQNRLGGLFMMVIQLTFGNVMPNIAVLILQRMIVKRERAAGTYRAISAFLSKLMAQIPFVVAGTLLFAIPVYWMIGLKNTGLAFGTFLLALVNHAFCALCLGIMISSGAPNVRVGQILGPTIIVIFLIFGGQLVNLATAPESLKWIKWISLIRYTYAALAVNEFTDLKFNCPNPPVGCIPNGEAVLSQFSLNEVTPVGLNIIACLCLGIGFIIIGFFLYNIRSRPLMRLK